MCNNDSRDELWRYFPSQGQGVFPQLIHWSENEDVCVQVNPAIRHQYLQLSDITLVVNVSQCLVEDCLRWVSAVYSNGGKINCVATKLIPNWQC